MTCDRDEAIRKRRLASPDHYRLYFALAGPSHALTQDNFTSMWAAAEAGVDQAGSALLRLYDEHAAGSLTKADLLLDRVRSGAYEVLTPGQCENLLVRALAGDGRSVPTPPIRSSWFSSLWDRAERLIPILLSRLEPARRAAVVTQCLEKERPSVGLHRCSGTRRSHMAAMAIGCVRKSGGYFTNPELDRITELTLGRYRAMSASDVLARSSASSRRSPPAWPPTRRSRPSW